MKAEVFQYFSGKIHFLISADQLSKAIDVYDDKNKLQAVYLV